MGKDSDITTGLLEILSTSLPVAWHAVEFEPPAGQDSKWLSVKNFPSEPLELGWGNTDAVYYTGFLQINIHFRPTAGGDGQRRLMDAIGEAETIMGQYSKGTEAGPVRVKSRPWRAEPVEDETGFYIPVTIPYGGIISQP